jgi:hypothetical protein
MSRREGRPTTHASGRAFLLSNDSGETATAWTRHFESGFSDSGYKAYRGNSFSGIERSCSRRWRCSCRARWDGAGTGEGKPKRQF